MLETGSRQIDNTATQTTLYLRKENRTLQSIANNSATQRDQFRSEPQNGLMRLQSAFSPNGIFQGRVGRECEAVFTWFQAPTACRFVPIFQIVMGHR